MSRRSGLVHRFVTVLSLGAVVFALSATGATAAEKKDNNKSTTTTTTPKGSSSSTGSPSGPVLAKLDVQKTKVDVQPSGSSTFAAGVDGASLKQGDTIRTDETGRAEVDYTDGSVMRLDVSTEYQITKLTDNQGARQTQGKLNVGKTWHRVAAVAETGEYGVTGASATAAVEGTAFLGECITVDECQFTAVVDFLDFGNGIVLAPGQTVPVNEGNFGQVEQLTVDQVTADAWIRENLLTDWAAGLGDPSELNAIPKPAPQSVILTVENGVVVDVQPVPDVPPAPPPPPPPPPPPTPACSLPVTDPPFVFDGSPGTGAPPDTLGTCAMTPFADDSRPLGDPVTTVDAPGGGELGFSTDPGDHVTHLQVGDGWGTWSNGYEGDVYFVDGSNLTMTLPDGTVAFYFYVEPNSFGTFSVVVVLQDGTTSGMNVNGQAGAKYVGSYTTNADNPLQSVRVEGPDTGFAVGEFGISTQPPAATTTDAGASAAPADATTPAPDPPPGTTPAPDPPGTAPPDPPATGPPPDETVIPDPTPAPPTLPA